MSTISLCRVYTSNWNAYFLSDDPLVTINTGGFGRMDRWTDGQTDRQTDKNHQMITQLQ